MMPKKSPTTHTTHAVQVSQMSRKKSYSREFKLETGQLLKSSGKTKADLERELGLYPGQIHLWERAFNRKEHDVEQAFPGAGHQSDAENELRQLKREIEILRQERDILKKAIAHRQSLSSPRRKTEIEVRLHPQAQGRVRTQDHVPSATGIQRRILHVGQASR
ncbi:hypothetical protein BH10PLA2_BH10PLA2_35790 [soil metagenome]